MFIRLSNAFDMITKLVLLHTFLLRHFIFYLTVLHFCKPPDTMVIEKVPYRAVKYVLNDFNSSCDF